MPLVIPIVQHFEHQTARQEYLMLDARKLRSILSHLHVGPSDPFPSSFKLKFFMHSHLSLHAIYPIPPPSLIF